MSGYANTVMVSLLVCLGLNLASAQSEVRIGYQRGGLSTLLQDRQLIENALGEDVRVSWILFPAGPQLLEAMNAGAIDFGSTGDSPPIFAQAAGVPLRYVAGQRSFSDEAVIVPADSEIDSLADLQGKKVAYTVGSSANYTIVKALGSVGLSLDDIESIPLAPADARAAFQGGSVDAWVVWAPFLTSAQLGLGAKALITRRELVDGRSYYLAAERFVTEHPDWLEVILEQHQLATSWADTHRPEYYALLSADTGIPTKVWDETYAGREFYPLEPVSAEVVASQQEVVDTFFGLGVIPEAVDIAADVWVWQPKLTGQ